MKSTLDQIEEIKKNGYTLSFSDVFNHAFENYKKIALYAGLILLVVLIISSFFGSGIFISLFGAEHLNKGFFESLQKQEPTSEKFLIYMAFILGITAVFSPFTAGFLKMANCAERDEKFSFLNIFGYYKAPYFFRIFTSTLLINIVNLLISIGFNLIGLNAIDLFLSVAISLYTSLTIPLIIFGDLNITAAIRSSIIVVSKQPIVIALLFIVAIIGSFVGFIGLYICVVFTIPIIYSVQYAIYSAIIGIKNQDSIDSSKSV